MDLISGPPATIPSSHDATTTSIPVRLAVGTLVPHVNKAMNALDAAAHETLLESGLLHLVRARASQLNGCAYCVDTHARDALAEGDDARRVFALPVWRDTPFFTPRERAALELIEAMTRLTEAPVSDETFARASEHFTDVELAELFWAVTVINAWNRLGATARPWPLS